LVLSALSLGSLAAIASQAAQAQTYNVLYNFLGGSAGHDPYAGLTMDKLGNLYGTDGVGGTGDGIAFRLNHTNSGWIFTTIYKFGSDFLAQDGAGPLARVIIGPDGRLYGTTASGGEYGGFNGGGCGVVFDLTPPAPTSPFPSGSWPETVAHKFTNMYDGCSPGNGNLVFDHGYMYGTTENGGLGCQEEEARGCGTVYAMTRGNENVRYRFAGGEDGADPRSGVVLDSPGNLLYGTTRYGGGAGYGVVYKLTLDGTEFILHRFSGGSDGAVPAGGVILDASSNLYGTTSIGGSGGGGTVFTLTLSGTFTVIYSFLGDNGPEDSLAMDAGGNLYGTTYHDGSSGHGMVFKLAPRSNGSWLFTDLHDFTGSDGAYPLGGVILDRNGNLYGTTSSGGTDGAGVVFEITP